jgi:hypothetical protein
MHPTEENSTMSDSPLNWKKFDADKFDPELELQITSAKTALLKQAGVNKADGEAVSKYVSEQMHLYKSNDKTDLNKAYIVTTFKPSEFESIASNDASLLTLQNFLLHNQFDWKMGSKKVQQALYAKFPKVGNVRIAGGREYVELDNLITVEDKTVAIEIETSINLDNGYFTLRQAVRRKIAEYGVMIVPWTPEGTGRADEGKALGKLDREFDGATDLRDGPIYRIAIVRGIDLCRLMAKRESA